MADGRKPPSYVYLSPEASQAQVELTNDGVYNLLPSEELWRDRQRRLKERGYDLRARYHPNWKPSWIGTNLDPEYCEDAVMASNFNVMDARRRADGLLVAIKSVTKNSQEVQISRFLSSLQPPENHCVPVYDVLDDPLNPSHSLMVMQYLRPFDDPDFIMFGEVVDFVTQMLEGLAFLHSQCVAHRDIAALNVMMDGRALFPGGHHPASIESSPDLYEDLVPLLRIDNPVRYFYVDFGLSVRFQPGASTHVVGNVGRDAEVPELSSTVPYDAYKADIYALGNLFDKELAQKYHGLDFLRPLIDSMKQRRPQSRPATGELVERYRNMRGALNPSGFRWRLGSKTAPVYERLFNDTVAVAKDSLSQLRRFVRP
ncbi:uncharacterized protein TRAVEDRAFT_173401 [Trametes versicolor FP-101664 SS1]|uniref:uncharacterized protein n=1 Tax=Trametes versicolor (strain FP-101664) TaxID=717944 RepID=UPI0004622584|nr:uncharacterized protein TRAVEDRAFT_173401 [Trametes versicolor FP-101664 SS1]EIW54102.1 hypothetical protein TRAVEDRAFT_173401 [Trametes versicolor FP-101664 SS1]